MTDDVVIASSTRTPVAADRIHGVGNRMDPQEIVKIGVAKSCKFFTGKSCTKEIWIYKKS